MDPHLALGMKEMAKDDNHCADCGVELTRLNDGGGIEAAKHWGKR
jgi:hypothetical protein